MKQLPCWLFGHSYYVARRFSKEERLVVCMSCGRLWAMHDGVKAFLPWDSDFEKLYCHLEEVR
jgi:hypothetical protein